MSLTKGICMEIKINFKTTVVMSCLIALQSTLATLYYKLSGYQQLFLIILTVLFMIMPALSFKRLSTMPVYALLVIAMVFFFVFRNPNFAGRGIPITGLLYLTILLFIWLSRYHDIEWMKWYVHVALCFYMFYALYTIAMFFIPQLFTVTLNLFPNSATTLISQYKNGCMPGLTNHYSTNGMVVVMSFLISGCIMIYRWTESHLWKIVFLLSAAGLLLTGKRAHIVFGGASLFLAYYLYMSNKKRTRLVQLIAIAVALVVFLVLIIHFVPALSVFLRRFSESAEDGDVLLGRGKMWKVAIDGFKTSPIFGIGWGRFISINIHAWNAHNIYLQLLCETGVAGVAIFFTFFVFFLVSTMSKIVYVRRHGIDENHICMYLMISLAVQVFFLLYGFTGNPLYDKEMYIPYYVACAMSAYRSKDDIKSMASSDKGVVEV